MSSKVAIVTLHGMGRAESDYATPFFLQLERRVTPANWAECYTAPIFYQNILQANQDRVWDRMERRGLRWEFVRRFVLFGFSDAATIYYRPQTKNSTYFTVQSRIRDTLIKLLREVRDPETPAIIMAHSLGAHIISCYLWDALHGQGIWSPEHINPRWDESELDFLKLKTTRVLFTVGCNIPIFVAGLDHIEAIPRLNAEFEWYNYFDKDDALGWPLRPLSDTYKHVITRDIPIESGNLWERLTPLSHNSYFRNRLILDHAASAIELLHEAQQR